jgi:hypothetical protein
MLTPINERSERALERWQKLRKSLSRAVTSLRPVQKGRFTVEPYMASPRRTRAKTPIKPGTYGRFQVINTSPKKLQKPTKNARYYLQKKRNKIQRAVNAVKNANKSKYQRAMANLKARHKIELNNLEKRHQQNEDNLYNKHFINSNKKITQLLQALNNINNQLA